MKYCKTCRIQYHSPLDSCLFCNNKLTDLDSEPLHYHYPEVKRRKRIGHTFEKIFQFLFVIANLICLTLDFYITKPAIHWSLFVLVSTLFFHLTVVIWKGNRTLINRLILFLLLTIGLLISIGLISKKPHWAVDFILPLSLVSINFLLLFFVVGHKKRMHDYGIYVVSISILGLLPTLLLLFDYPIRMWPSITCSLYSLTTLFGLFFFTSKTTKEELKRRFYL